MVFGVDIDDLRINNLTLFKNFCGSSELLVSDLGDVDETVNAGDDLCECTEGHHGNDGYGSNVVYVVLIGEELPGVGIFGLVAERDSVLFAETTSLGEEILSQESSEL